LHYSDTGERVTEVLDFPSRDGLSVQAIRVDYAPSGFTGGAHRHPAGAYVYVLEGSVMFGVDGREPVLLEAGASFYEPPGALHSVSRNASGHLPASLIAFFVLREGERPTVTTTTEEGVMRAVRLHAPGGPEQLAIEEIDRPRPDPGEALVRVHAAAITRDELQWPVGRLPAIPSYELSGVVADIGAGVTSVAAGDEVFALTPFDRDGVAADYTALPAELLVSRPAALGDAESAAIPLPALTAWQGLFDHGRLRAGERVLIDGAAGGVGGLAVQLARARGAHVIGTASAANLQSVRELGAHEAVDAATRFEDAIEAVDLVLDTAGGERLRRSAAVLGAGGRLVSVAEPPRDVGVYFTVQPNRDQLTSIARLVEAGELRAPAVEVFPLTSAREAFARSLEHGRPGKVVLGLT
jgi:NADPH:quinone reductase-like Zn-dependent oxidoreductase/quercetin dioxygenase-like cupin family protein